MEDHANLGLPGISEVVAGSLRNRLVEAGFVNTGISDVRPRPFETTRPQSAPRGFSTQMPEPQLKYLGSGADTTGRSFHLHDGRGGLVEAGGIEPPSEGFPPKVTTCLVAVLLSSSKPPATGSCATSRFGSRPHPLRQRNRSIPLNDALSDPAGESRQDAGCLSSQSVLLFVCSYLQSCVINEAAGPRHATLTSHPRRTHIAPKR